MNVQELHRELTRLINEGKATFPVKMNVDDHWVMSIYRVVEGDNRIILDGYETLDSKR